jgi:outer membrane protein, heavy metal efflux system
LEDAKTRTTEALLSLASLIGLQEHALEKVRISTEAVETVPSLAALSLPDLRRTALFSRPDVLAALVEYDAAETSVRLEIAKQYPDLNIGPGYQWDQGENKWSFDFSLTLPVLKRNEGPIAEAEARRGEAEARLVALQARLIAEIETATAAFSTASVNLTAVNDLMSVQTKRLDSVVSMFYTGKVDRVALANARLDYHVAELSRLNVLIERQAALGRLEDVLQYPLATGTPIDVVHFVQRHPTLTKKP